MLRVSAVVQIDGNMHEDGIVSICDACGGRIGILSTFKRGRGAEMMSTQSHLRAAS
jgi:hypothetical protein